MRCSGLERSRRGKMFYCNIRTPVHRIAIPKVMWLLYPKFWVQTFGLATLWTGVSVFCNLHTAFPLYCPVCVPRPRSEFYCHRSRFRSWSPAIHSQEISDFSLHLILQFKECQIWPCTLQVSFYRKKRSIVLSSFKQPHWLLTCSYGPQCMPVLSTEQREELRLRRQPAEN